MRKLMYIVLIVVLCSCGISRTRYRMDEIASKYGNYVVGSFCVSLMVMRKKRGII